MNENKEIYDRLGTLEKETAVQDNRIKTVEDVVEKMAKTVTSLQVKIALIVGGIFVLGEIWDRLPLK